MKLTLDEKVARDFPLNKGELQEATGESRIALERQRVPWLNGKIRKSEYEKHRAKLIDAATDAAKATKIPPKAAALPATGSPDIGALEAKLEHWKQDHARRGKGA